MKNIYFGVLGFASVCTNSLALGNQANQNANRINELKGDIRYIAKFNTETTSTFPSSELS